MFSKFLLKNFLCGASGLLHLRALHADRARACKLRANPASVHPRGPPPPAPHALPRVRLQRGPCVTKFVAPRAHLPSCLDRHSDGAMVDTGPWVPAAFPALEWLTPAAHWTLAGAGLSVAAGLVLVQLPATLRAMAAARPAAVAAVAGLATAAWAVLLLHAAHTVTPRDTHPGLVLQVGLRRKKKKKEKKGEERREKRK